MELALNPSDSLMKVCSSSKTGPQQVSVNKETITIKMVSTSGVAVSVQLVASMRERLNTFHQSKAVLFGLTAHIASSSNFMKIL
jgi:hypothetical protein